MKHIKDKFVELWLKMERNNHEFKDIKIRNKVDVS